MSVEEASVLVVGGGPVGLAMAAEMSYRGVSTILLEKRPTTSDSPKAFALTSRTLEHFRRLGLQEKIQEAAYPSDQRVSGVFSTGWTKGREVLRLRFSPWGQLNRSGRAEFLFFRHKTSLGLPMLLPQFTSEAVIRKHVDETAKCVRMFWGWRVKSVNQDESGITVKAENEAGEEKTFRAGYLVGCDGGSSFIRKELGLHMYGSFVVSRAVTIWFSSPELTEHLKTKGTAGFAFVMNDKIGCLMIMLNQKGDFAVHVFLQSSTSDEKVQWHVQNPTWCVESAIGSSDFPVKILSVSGYNMHALLTTKYRVGRCFLAGDSAHQWLPAGGLGLNTGLSDVADLAWKLEAAVKGYGGDALLDSYQIERRPLADLTRRYALEFGRALLLDSRPLIRLRAMMMENPLTNYLIGKLAASAAFGALTSKGIDLVLGFQYSNSNVIAHEYSWEDGKVRLRRNEDGGKFTPASLPGCRAPHVELPDCPSIIDLFGKGFVLLVVGEGVESGSGNRVELSLKGEESGAESHLKELKEMMSERRVPFSVYTLPPLPEVTSLYDRKYFLVRPDGVVAWRADFQPSSAESAKILDTVLGHVTSPPRLPLPTTTTTAAPSSETGAPAAYVGFVRDLVVRFSITGLLHYSTNMSCLTAGMVGFGAFLLLRAASVAAPPRRTASTSRHKAAAVTKDGTSADGALEILPKHVGKFGMDDVLIRVHATTFTDFDLSMMKGHGRNTYQRHGKQEGDFPLILGRECSGEVVAVGDSVSEFLPGDKVYAATPPHRQGCHAQLVAVNERHVAFKPSNVDHKEAASLPWAATTAWTALVTHADLGSANARGKRVLVLRGTSDVGAFAVQLLKAWGAHVTITCPTNAESMSMARHLGADKVVSEDKMVGPASASLSGYDVVLDTVGGGYERPSLSALKCYRGSVYVSCVSPREALVDSLGGFLGELAFSSLYRYKVLSNRLFGGRGFYYSSAEVGGAALGEVRALVERGAVRPRIGAVYTLDEIADAHKHVQTGRTPGKVVITVP